MYNIVNQLLSLPEYSFVGEEGLTPLKATHLLLTEEHYANILKSLGINHISMPMKFVELYGLILVYSKIPLEEPRVLYFNE